MKKILLADDVKVVRVSLRTILKRFPQEWDFFEGQDGSSILEAYFEHQPDIILLDVVLPEVDGWEILRTIRDVDEDVRIVMLTASDEPKDVLKAVELGADGFVGKPFDMDELADALGLRKSLAYSA